MLGALSNRKHMHPARLSNPVSCFSTRCTIPHWLVQWDFSRLHKTDLSPQKIDTCGGKSTLPVSILARIDELQMPEIFHNFHTVVKRARAARVFNTIFSQDSVVGELFRPTTTSNLLCSTKRAQAARVLPSIAVGPQRSGHVAGWHLHSTVQFSAV